jgi:hypothetical protein
MREIGTPIFELISKPVLSIGYDINPKIMDVRKFEKYSNLFTFMLDVCIPFNNNFLKNILELNKKFDPKIIIIRSTIKSGITKLLQKKLQKPIIYSVTRGVHRRMANNVKRYTNFFAIDKSKKNNHVILNQLIFFLQNQLLQLV